MRRELPLVFVVLMLLFTAPPSVEARQGIPDELRTYSERSGWVELTPHDEVLRFYEDLARLSPDARLRQIGESREGRPLLLLTLSRPAVSEPWEALQSGRPIMFIGAQVHGDEQAGKEGLMIFARELAFGDAQDLLDEVIFVFVPQINPDGHEAGEWGTRTNAAGYNVNRDYSRLVNPESRAVVEEVLRPWRPHITIDAHELTGPRIYDFYALHPSNLNTPSRVRELAAGPATQAVQDAIEGAGYSYFPYHLQPSDPTLVPEEGILGAGYGVRILRSYGGARGAISLLFESKRADDPRVDIEPRVRWQRLGMEGVARYAAENAQEVLEGVAQGREEMRRLGSEWNPADSIVIRTELVSSGVVDYRMPEMRPREDGPGYEETGSILEMEVPFRDSAVAVVSRVRPVGYLLEPHRGDLVEQLLAHGLQVERYREPLDVSVESFQVDSVHYAPSTAEGYFQRDVWTTETDRTVHLPRGAYLIRSSQPMATLAFALLEPEDIDSFASNGEFAAEKSVGGFLPVHRLRELPQGSPFLLSW